MCIEIENSEMKKMNGLKTDDDERLQVFVYRVRVYMYISVCIDGENVVKGDV